MKKKFFAVLVSAILVLSVFLVAAYAKHQPVKDEVNLNQAQVVESSVKSSEVTSVSPDDAIDAALRHAGVARENAVLFGAPSLDRDDGKVHYDVEFGYNGFEYDYEVALADGSVLKAEKEAERVKDPVKESVHEKPVAPEKESVSAKSEVSVNKESDNKENNKGYISVEAAKQKALDDAGVKAEDAVFVKAYYDADDIVPHYDVKFEANGYEYEYEIKASDGKVIEKDVDREVNPVSKPSKQDEYISADKAKSIAYEHASVKAADVRFSKAELDRDDLIVHYEVEFVAGNFEYEYEINAESGKVIAFDKEFND
ncbi:MAG: PepSY domain-containing protein [Clostridia bacterium]|nr:PepSY domain-containing protein [Clostridia bacterium]